MGLSAVRRDARRATARGQATSRAGGGVRGGTFCPCPVPGSPGTCGPAPSWGTASTRQHEVTSLSHADGRGSGGPIHTRPVLPELSPTASPNPPTAVVVNSTKSWTQQTGQPQQRKHTSKGPVWGAAQGSWGAEQSRARAEGRNQRGLTPEPSSGSQPRLYLESRWEAVNTQ